MQLPLFTNLLLTAALVVNLSLITQNLTRSNSLISCSGLVNIKSYNVLVKGLANAYDLAHHTRHPIHYSAQKAPASHPLQIRLKQQTASPVTGKNGQGISLSNINVAQTPTLNQLHPQHLEITNTSPTTTYFIHSIVSNSTEFLISEIDENTKNIVIEISENMLEMLVSNTNIDNNIENFDRNYEQMLINNNIDIEHYYKDKYGYYNYEASNDSNLVHSLISMNTVNAKNNEIKLGNSKTSQFIEVAPNQRIEIVFYIIPHLVKQNGDRFISKRFPHFANLEVILKDSNYKNSPSINLVAYSSLNYLNVNQINFDLSYLSELDEAEVSKAFKIQIYAKDNLKLFKFRSNISEFLHLKIENEYTSDPFYLLSVNLNLKSIKKTLRNEMNLIINNNSGLYRNKNILTKSFQNNKSFLLNSNIVTLDIDGYLILNTNLGDFMVPINISNSEPIVEINEEESYDLDWDKLFFIVDENSQEINYDFGHFYNFNSHANQEYSSNLDILYARSHKLFSLSSNQYLSHQTSFDDLTIEGWPVFELLSLRDKADGITRARSDFNEFNTELVRLVYNEEGSKVVVVLNLLKLMNGKNEGSLLLNPANENEFDNVALRWTAHFFKKNIASLSVNTKSLYLRNLASKNYSDNVKINTVQLMNQYEEEMIVNKIKISGCGDYIDLLLDEDTFRKAKNQTVEINETLVTQDVVTVKLLNYGDSSFNLKNVSKRERSNKRKKKRKVVITPDIFRDVVKCQLEAESSLGRFTYGLTPRPLPPLFVSSDITLPSANVTNFLTLSDTPQLYRIYNLNTLETTLTIPEYLNLQQYYVSASISHGNKKMYAADVRPISRDGYGMSEEFIPQNIDYLHEVGVDSVNTTLVSKPPGESIYSLKLPAGSVSKVLLSLKDGKTFNNENASWKNVHFGVEYHDSANLSEKFEVPLAVHSSQLDVQIFQGEMNGQSIEASAVESSMFGAAIGSQKNLPVLSVNQTFSYSADSREVNLIVPSLFKVEKVTRTLQRIVPAKNDVLSMAVLLAEYHLTNTFLNKSDKQSLSDKNLFFDILHLTEKDQKGQVTVLELSLKCAKMLRFLREKKLDRIIHVLRGEVKGDANHTFVESAAVLNYVLPSHSIVMDNVIDFGSVSIGAIQSKRLSLTNPTSETLDLLISPGEKDGIYYRQVDNSNFDRSTVVPWWEGGGFYLLDQGGPNNIGKYQASYDTLQNTPYSGPEPVGSILETVHNVSLHSSNSEVYLVTPSLHSINSFVGGCEASCGLRSGGEAPNSLQLGTSVPVTARWENSDQSKFHIGASAAEKSPSSRYAESVASAEHFVARTVVPPFAVHPLHARDYHTLPPNSSLEIELFFRPPTRGVFEKKLLVISSETGVEEVTLKGRGLLGKLSIFVNDRDFDYLAPVNFRRGPKHITIRVQNEGDLPIGFNEISIDHGNLVKLEHMNVTRGENSVYEGYLNSTTSSFEDIVIEPNGFKFFVASLRSCSFTMLRTHVNFEYFEITDNPSPFYKRRESIGIGYPRELGCEDVPLEWSYHIYVNMIFFCGLYLIILLQKRHCNVGRLTNILEDPSPSSSVIDVKREAVKQFVSRAKTGKAHWRVFTAAGDYIPFKQQQANLLGDHIFKGSMVELDAVPIYVEPVGLNWKEAKSKGIRFNAVNGEFVSKLLQSRGTSHPAQVVPTKDEAKQTVKPAPQSCIVSAVPKVSAAEIKETKPPPPSVLKTDRSPKTDQIKNLSVSFDLPSKIKPGSKALKIKSKSFSKTEPQKQNVSNEKAEEDKPIGVSKVSVKEAEKVMPKVKSIRTSNLGKIEVTEPKKVTSVEDKKGDKIITNKVPVKPAKQTGKIITKTVPVNPVKAFEEIQVENKTKTKVVDKKHKSAETVKDSVTMSVTKPVTKKEKILKSSPASSKQIKKEEPKVAVKDAFPNSESKSEIQVKPAVVPISIKPTSDPEQHESEPKIEPEFEPQKPSMELAPPPGFNPGSPKALPSVFHKATEVLLLSPEKTNDSDESLPASIPSSRQVSGDDEIANFPTDRLAGEFSTFNHPIDTGNTLWQNDEFDEIERSSGLSLGSDLNFSAKEFSPRPSHDHQLGPPSLNVQRESSLPSRMDPVLSLDERLLGNSDQMAPFDSISNNGVYSSQPGPTTTSEWQFGGLNDNSIGVGESNPPSNNGSSLNLAPGASGFNIDDFLNGLLDEEGEEDETTPESQQHLTFSNPFATETSNSVNGGTSTPDIEQQVLGGIYGNPSRFAGNIFDEEDESFKNKY